jgi:hypothetical protein
MNRPARQSPVHRIKLEMGRLSAVTNSCRPASRIVARVAQPFIVLSVLAGIVSVAIGSDAADTQFLSVKAVDYHDQLELPVPALAGLETLVGRQAAERAAATGALPGPQERPHRPLLRVEFRSTKDLWGIARRKAVVFLHSSFCDRKDFAVLGDPTVYSGGRAVQWTNVPDSATTGSENVYYFYLNVSRRESPKSSPPQVGFDLQASPEDICFYVTGSGFLGYRSAIATVPKDAISAALRESQSRSDSPSE